MRAMLGGVTDNSPAGLAEPAGAASKISQTDVSQAWGLAPIMRFSRMRIFLHLLVGCRSIRADRYRQKEIEAPVRFHRNGKEPLVQPCLLYTSDAADEEDSVDLGGR